MVSKTISLMNLPQFCQETLKSLPEKSLILLSGEVGAGKTKFVECLLQAMGYDQVSSPTFTFHQEYLINKNAVHHFDLYRVENGDDLEGIGFWDTLSEANGIVIVEWPEIISKKSLPNEYHILNIKISRLPKSSNDDQRLYELTLTPKN